MRKLDYWAPEISEFKTYVCLMVILIMRVIQTKVNDDCITNCD